MEATLRERTNQVGMAAFLATATMLFTAFTAAYIIRRSGPDWAPIQLPPIVWFGAGILLASSATMEAARRRSSLGWLSATAALGALFALGQTAAWMKLAAQGVFLASSPHASFFLVLTVVHGAHLLGGLGAIAWVLARGSGLPLCAAYWHFLGAVWIYLLLLLTTL